MDSKSKSTIQELFLNKVRSEKTPVTIFLLSGVKLQGVITAFDLFSLTLRKDAITQLVYKHAISTVLPAEATSPFPETTL